MLPPALKVTSDVAPLALRLNDAALDIAPVVEPIEISFASDLYTGDVIAIEYS
jgi:hypothetical protein